MASSMVRPKQMSERRWIDGPDGIHDTMLNVAEMATFRSERFHKRYRLEVPERVFPWTAETDRRIPCSSTDTSVVAQTFMDSLPGDLVKQSLWPKLMNGPSAHDNFKTLCLMRCVCKAWMYYGEGSKEWPFTLEAWKKGDHRYISEYEVNPFLDTDSESDPSWGYESWGNEDSDAESLVDPE